MLSHSLYFTLNKWRIIRLESRRAMKKIHAHPSELQSQQNHLQMHRLRENFVVPDGCFSWCLSFHSSSDYEWCGLSAKRTSKITNICGKYLWPTFLFTNLIKLKFQRWLTSDFIAKHACHKRVNTTQINWLISA